MASTASSTVGTISVITSAKPKIDVNILSLVGVLFFYAMILLVGIYASWRAKKKGLPSGTRQTILGGRNLGLVTGIFTMTATWVGGGYINGTAEYVFTQGYGLIWTQAPYGYALSLIIGGTFFAEKMREAGYTTMLDPFQCKFGHTMTAFLCLVAVVGEILWSAAILGALGSAMEVILGVKKFTAVIVSAIIALGYTLFGGLVAVVSTDVVQLGMIFFGLWLSIPFALMNNAVGNLFGEAARVNGTYRWAGELTLNYVPVWLDFLFALVFGGVPWQVYFQRVLSTNNSKQARIVSFAAGFGCIAMAIPSVLIGMIASRANFTLTNLGREVNMNTEASNILPYVLQYLCPPAVSFFGLGAIAAAVMSSSDSSILSSSSLLIWNVYRPLMALVRTKVSEEELHIALRLAMCLVCASATVVAVNSTSTYQLWFLSAEAIYALLFPPLVCVLYFRRVNIYGAITGYAAALFVRMGGETDLYEPLLKFPGYFDDGTFRQQLFPYRTCAMLLNMACLVGFSLLTDLAHGDGWLRYDPLGAFPDGPSESSVDIVRKESSQQFISDDEWEKMSYLSGIGIATAKTESVSGLEAPSDVSAMSSGAPEVSQQQASITQ